MIGVEVESKEAHEAHGHSHDHKRSPGYTSDEPEMLCGCGVPQIMTSRFRYLLLGVFILACIITGAAQSMSGGIFLFTIVFLCFVVIGDLGYSRFLADKIFELNDDEVCPANDPSNEGHIDFEATDCDILWGHHFTSIAGAAPIIGPAQAALWGWLPAALWIGFGVIFAGAVHDFSALVLSARHGGKSIGELAGLFMGWRARLLFSILLFFLCWIVIAVFENAIGNLFIAYPATVVPVWIEIVFAFVLGCLVKFKIVGPFWPSIVSITTLYLVLYATSEAVDDKPNTFTMKAFGFDCANSIATDGCKWGDRQMWTVFLSLYAFVASLLPIWLLIQPRDYLNAHQLEFCMIAVLIGLLSLSPDVNAPAIDDDARLGGAEYEPMPFLFVTIACGAVSGFHGLVSSSVTSKQLKKMTDARPIGYTAMLGEGTLAILTLTLVVSAAPDYKKGWPSGFLEGGAKCLEEWGFSYTFSKSAMALLVVSFAATTLDSAVRIQRVLLNEFGDYCIASSQMTYYIGVILQNKVFSALFAIVPAVWLANSETVGPLWQLFGATNQLIASLTLTLTSIYLYRWKGGFSWLFTGVPAIGMFCFIPWALIHQTKDWFDECKGGDKWCGDTDAPGAYVMRNLIAIVVAICFFWMIIEVIVWILTADKEDGGGKVYGKKDAKRQMAT